MLRKVVIFAAIAWPIAATAEPPRVVAVIEQGADPTLAARVTEAARTATGELTSFAVGQAAPDRVEGLGQRTRADLVLVVTARGVRIWDTEAGAFHAGRLPLDAPPERIRQFMARAARALQPLNGGTRTWVAIAVAGTTAAVFIAALALRSLGDQNASTGLTLRFVAP